jgi:two-component system sensor histidine kinase AtoS
MVPVTGSGDNPTHWISIHRDITERKRAEEEREHLLSKIEEINRDLTELNMELESIGTERTMGLLALMLADRVRNPAVVIGNTSRRIMDKETVPEALKERLQVIFDEAGHLEAIVRDFESLQKKRQAIFRYHDINDLLTGIVSAIEKEFSLKGIKLDIKLSETPLKINMQKELLRVAIFHLLRDSIEATTEGETLSVATDKGEDEAVISISNTGICISKEDIGRLFEPDFSLREERFGLGLPLVKQIVSEHLGSIEIESEAGKGTIFRLIFPLRWS